VDGGRRWVDPSGGDQNQRSKKPKKYNGDEQPQNKRPEESYSRQRFDGCGRRLSHVQNNSRVLYIEPTRKVVPVVIARTSENDPGRVCVAIYSIYPLYARMPQLPWNYFETCARSERNWSSHWFPLPPG